MKRGVPAYQGDIGAILATFPDDSFDHVILSRTVEQLEDADSTLAEGLRVGRHVTVGFVNKGFWINRLNALFHGNRTVNEVYPKPWYESMPSNPFSVAEFEAFCDERKIVIKNRAYLSGDWRNECRKLPNLLAGYAIYDLSSID